MHLGPALAIICLLWSSAGAWAGDGQARFAGRYAWSVNEDWFGGFSGLELDASGTRLTAISDRTSIVTARIKRRNGRIAGISLQSRNQLRAASGKKLFGRGGDAEGLAAGPGASVFVSFEGVHRISLYPSPDGTPRPLPRPRAFRGLHPNGSFEALARDVQGRLYTLPETSRDADGQIPVFVWDGRVWGQPFALQPRGRFKPAGADFGPDGRFYLLERTVGLFGFRSRVRRWEIGPTGATNEATLLVTRAGTHDNLEGLSVWRDRAGRLRATMISDDNFNFFQTTELVEYLLPE